MKKTLNFFAAAALVAFAAVACQKEQLSDISSEGEETVTFTVQTDAAATKALADNDGLGAGLDRCLVAVYMKTGNSAEPYKLYDTPSTTTLMLLESPFLLFQRGFWLTLPLAKPV